MSINFSVLSILLVVSSGTAATDDLLSDRSIQARIISNRTAQVTLTLNNQAQQPCSHTAVIVLHVRHRFLFGCNAFMLNSCPSRELENAYRIHFRKICNYATLPFYWSSYERTQGKPSQEKIAAMARWCHENNITPKGHPLAWHECLPGWIMKMPSRQAYGQLSYRISREINIFNNSITVWDVLNEPVVMPSYKTNGNPIARYCANTGITAMINQTFRIARNTGPRATLILNDYNTSQRYAEIISNNLNAGTPIDAIGIQSHMHRGYWGKEKLWNVCNRFARFGKPIHFTELTITSSKGEELQARQVAECYRILFSHPAVKAITWWDLSDRGAWRSAPAGLLRKDMTPKPAYHVLDKYINRKWRTGPLTLTTGKKGRVAFRGFLGTYHIITDTTTNLITISHPGSTNIMLQISSKN
jgi:GH35 family endo-1,4-beta-xylanase